MRRLARRRGDEGSALVLALFFVVIFSLLISAVITFSDTGLKASKGFQGQRAVSAAVEGGVDAAINRFRSGAPCDDYSAPVGSDGQPVGGHPVTVRCTDVGSSAGGTANKPTTALLSLPGVPGETGISAGGEDLRVRGDVFSNSAIDVAAGGQLLVEGGVSAVGDCSGNIQATAGKNCGQTGGADPVLGRDPDFLKALEDVPARQTVPPCGSGTPSWLVRLVPGYYDDATALTALTGGGCPNSVVWLEPGNYYFDFGYRTVTGEPTPAWVINDPSVNVVGGAPKAWDPAAASKPSQFPVPGACEGPNEQPSGTGIQVAVGGNSRLQVDAGAIELCAQASTTEQEIALYGLGRSSENHTVVPTAVPSSPGFDQKTVSNALLIGEKSPGTADASLTTAQPHGSLTLTGYRPSLPSGAAIDSAELRVSHKEDGNVTPSVTVGTCAGATRLTAGTSTTLTEERSDLAACGITKAQDFSGLAVTVDADLASGGSGAEHLDGVWIDVAYRDPDTRKPTLATGVGGNTAFTPAENALEIGEQPVAKTADANLTATSPASIVLAGWADPPLPPGSVVESAVLRVAHQDETGVSSVTVTPSATGCTAQNVAVRPNAVITDSVDLKAACGGSFDAAKLVGLTVRYDATVTGAGTATDHLDGIWLDLLYRPHRQATTATVNPGNGFDPLDADKVRAIDGTTADAVLGSTGPASASVTVQGGFDLPALPAGASIDEAVLRIVHRDGGQIDDVSVTPSFAPGNTCVSAKPLHVHRSVLTPDTVDLKACGLTAAALANLTVTFTATVPSGTPTTSTEQLDGIELDVSWQPEATRKPTTATSATTDFTSPDSGRTIDGTTSDSTLTVEHPSSSITTSAYDPPLPPGSVVESARLRVAHREDPQVGSISLSTSLSGPACGLPPLRHQEVAPPQTETVTLPVACINSQPNGLDGMTVTYTAQLGTGQTNAVDRLDGIELDVVFRPPRFEPVSGCAATGPYDPAGTDPAKCALVKSSRSATARFLVDGTVYAPTAAIDLGMTNVSFQVVTRGIIARTMHLDIAPASAYERPTIGVPNPESVLFTAYADPPHTNAAMAASPTDANSNPEFTSPDNAKVIDGGTSDAAVGPTETRSLTLTDFGPAPAAADALMLSVRHKDDFPAGVDPVVTVRLSAANNKVCTVGLPPRADMATDRVDLNSAPCSFTVADFTSLTVTYSVTVPSGGTAGTDYLDGIDIQVLSAPKLRARVDFDHGDVRVEGWSVLR